MQTVLRIYVDCHLRLSQSVRRRRDDGAGLVEYALLVALIATVCIAAVTYFGDATSQKFSGVASDLGEI